MRKALQAVLEELHLPLTAAQQDQLLQFAQLILTVRSKVRLVGETSSGKIIGKHIYDSLVPLSMSLVNETEILDVGTGGGFPGIPLKVARPDSRLFLMEANRRKINFLKHAVRQLGLQNVFFLHGRAELWVEQGHRERYPLVVSRAVAKMRTLIALTLPFVREGGKAILFKGPRWDEEIKDARETMETYGTFNMRKYDYRLPGGERRTLLVLEKGSQEP